MSSQLQTGKRSIESVPSKGKSKRRRPDLDTVYTINADGSRNFLHPADVHGSWTSRLNVLWTVLIVVYVGLPWITINGHPAVHFDLPGRSAYLFGVSFTNQDFYLMFFVFTAIGFALFVVTAIFGRVWCGFACPQTVFLEGVFRRVERWLEGPRNQRIRRNMGPNTFDKVWRKIVKHIAFLGLAYLVAHAFLSYFIPVQELLEVIRSHPREHATAFAWTMAFTGIMYFDFAWFREQTCLIICPYGRLQSALIDRDTLIVGYDADRGEPRAHGVDVGGDCIDCYRCVEVCPTGIDIRNGLQLECLGCTKCIDACDDIMDRIDKPQGLIRYDSQRAFDGETRAPLLRPRVILYLVLGFIGFGAAMVSLLNRDAFQANALRAVGLPYTLDEQHISNVFKVRLQNKTSGPATYLITQGEDPTGELEFIIGQPEVRLGAMEDMEAPVIVRLPRDRFDERFMFSLVVTDSATGRTKDVDVTFRGP